MDATKTTFYLPDDVRRRLKELAARRGRTVTQLLAEGADLVLARHGAAVDRETLAARAAEARSRLRRGLYSGPSLADAADDVVYGSARKRRR